MSLGGSGSAQAKRAEQRELKREAEMNDAMNRVNWLFGVNSSLDGSYKIPPPVGFNKLPTQVVTTGYDVTQGNEQADANKLEREKLYEDVRGDAYNLFNNELTDQYDDSSRNLKFNLARSGLLGSTVDLDKGAELGQLLDKNRIKIAGQADDIGLSARISDEQARLDLISRIQSGMDAESAIAGANRALENSVSEAYAQQNINNLGDMFGTFADAWRTSKVGDDPQVIVGGQASGPSTGGSHNRQSTQRVSG